MRKKGKARPTANGVPKDHLTSFHGMDDAKEIWAAIKTRFGGNANSKKMQKAVLKQQFEAFTITSKESLEKGYDRFQKILSQLDALGASVSVKMQITVLRSFLLVGLFSHDNDIQKTSSSSQASENVAFLSQAKASSSKHKPPRPLLRKWISIGQDCYDCPIKSQEVLQEAVEGQEWMKNACGICANEKEALMTIDEGQIKWVERLMMRKLNHALMAFTVNNEVSMCSKLCLDSFNALQAKYDELQSKFGDQEAALVAHKLAVKKAQEDIDDSLYVYGKHGPQPQSPSPTESNASSIVFSICPSNDSDGELGAVTNDSSTHYSTCQSNDSDGELGTITDHSVNNDSIPIPSSEQIFTQKTQSQVPTPPQTVDPSCAQHVKPPRQPIRTPVTPVSPFLLNRLELESQNGRELGARGKMALPVKTSAGYVWRKITPLSNTNSGPTPDSNVNVSRGPQGRPKPMKAWWKCSGTWTGNRAHLGSFQELSKVGSVTFWRESIRKISWKKYVAELLKKFDLVHVKASITPWRPSCLDNDEKLLICRCTLYRSMIGNSIELLISMLSSRIFKKSTKGLVSISWSKTNLLRWFAEIVDFLRGSNLRYALTANPTIYDSLVKQFWQSAVASTREDGSLEISATVDTKRGFQGAPKPLLPSMLLVATNLIAGQEHAAQAQTQPIPPPPPIPSTTPTPIPTSTPPPPPIPSTTPTPIPTSTPPPPPIPTPTSPPPPPETEPPTDEHTYEEQSPVHHHFSPSQAQAPSHMPTVKLVKKVKKLEGFLKRRNLVLTDSEDEEPEVQGRKSQADPQDSSKQGLVTPPTNNGHASGEEPRGRIMLQTLFEAAKNSLNGCLFKIKINTAGEVNAASIEVNTASKVNTAQRDVKEEELTEQQKKRKAQVQFEAQHYTNEDWDLIRAKLEANAELSKSMLGSELQGKDFAKEMVDLVNQRKKFFAEERARLKGTGPDPITAKNFT
ncbi:hypothetical protein Tco_0090994 [Tanacetum coccineum]